jgi:hypothetical protein
MDEHSKEIVKKIEQQEAVFAKKLATLEEKQKVNLDLVNEENAAIWEKLADKTVHQITENSNENFYKFISLVGTRYSSTKSPQGCES